MERYHNLPAFFAERIILVPHQNVESGKEKKRGIRKKNYLRNVCHPVSIPTSSDDRRLFEGTFLLDCAIDLLTSQNVKHGSNESRVRGALLWHCNASFFLFCSGLAEECHFLFLASTLLNECRKLCIRIVYHLPTQSVISLRRPAAERRPVLCLINTVPVLESQGLCLCLI